MRCGERATGSVQDGTNLGARIPAVTRIVHAIVVGLLTLSASGVISLAVAEPCTAYEGSRSEDGSCPPTCVTCGCCAQAVEPVTVVVSTIPEAAVADIPDPLPGVPRTTPRDIFHVPKLRVA
jgi:hypothetical protein